VVRTGTRFRIIEAADDLVVDGFHPFEGDNGWRWTKGDATVPLSLFDGFNGAIELVIATAGEMTYVGEGALLHVA
jgi:hypothetical protein